jgi:hypothetical protein
MIPSFTSEMRRLFIKYRKSELKEVNISPEKIDPLLLTIGDDEKDFSLE